MNFLVLQSIICRLHPNHNYLHLRLELLLITRGAFVEY
jgi:hypothetical protein